MRAAPRSLLCGSAWRAGDNVADTGFDELRKLCTSNDTRVPLALGMAGLLMQQTHRGRNRDSVALTPEYLGLLDAIGNPELTVALLYPAMYAKYEACEMSTALQLAQRVIDLADGDPIKGNLLTGSPLAFATAMRASARCVLGLPNWRDDFAQAIAFARVDPTTYVSIVMFKYMLGVVVGALVPGTDALNDTAEALQTARRCSEDFAVHMAELTRGIVLVSHDGPARSEGFEFLTKAREAASAGRFVFGAVAIVDLLFAADKARMLDVDAAIDLARHVVAEQLRTGPTVYLGAATRVLVESLIQRCRNTDIIEAEQAVETLAAVPAAADLVVYQLPLLRMRALLAQARDDVPGYRTFSDRYSALVRTLDFTGHSAVTLVAE